MLAELFDRLPSPPYVASYGNERRPAGIVRSPASNRTAAVIW